MSHTTYMVCVAYIDGTEVHADGLAINAFFSSWWIAIGNANLPASQNVAEIVEILSPPANTNVNLTGLVASLAYIFASMPGSAQNGTEMATAAQPFQRALAITPSIGDYLYPSTNVSNSPLIQIADVTANLATITRSVQSNLNQTLTSVMANVTQFLSFASQGNFTASTPSVPDQTNYLLYAFNTYIASAILSSTGINGVLAQDTNVQQLATNSTTLAYNLTDCATYNQQGGCGSWWYSENFKSTFGLNDFNNLNRSFEAALSGLFQNLTTGELLFEGAYECNNVDKDGQALAITVGPQGVNTGCISQLQVLTWNMACTDPTKPNCEFLEGPNQDNFFGKCSNQGSSKTPCYAVPDSYLGPLIDQSSQSSFQLQRG